MSEAHRWLDLIGSKAKLKLRKEVEEQIQERVVRKDWVRRSCIGIQDFERILTVLYTLDCWPQETRGLDPILFAPL